MKTLMLARAGEYMRVEICNNIPERLDALRVANIVRVHILVICEYMDELDVALVHKFWKHNFNEWIKFSYNDIKTLLPILSHAIKVRGL